MKLLNTALSFMGVNPTQLGVIALVVAAASGASYAAGRVQEAHGAVATVVKQQPAQVAAVTKAAGDTIDKGNAAIAGQQGKQDAADLASHQKLVQRANQLERDLKTARANLAKERSDACARDDTVIGGGALRLLLDTAAGVYGAAAGESAAAPDSAGADGSASAAAGAPPLTCGQFKAGYLNYAEWGRKAAARVEAFQEQARKLDLVPTEGVQP